MYIFVDRMLCFVVNTGPFGCESVINKYVEVRRRVPTPPRVVARGGSFALSCATVSSAPISFPTKCASLALAVGVASATYLNLRPAGARAGTPDGPAFPTQPVWLKKAEAVVPPLAVS